MNCKSLNPVAYKKAWKGLKVNKQYKKKLMLKARFYKITE